MAWPTANGCAALHSRPLDLCRLARSVPIGRSQKLPDRPFPARSPAVWPSLNSVSRGPWATAALGATRNLHLAPPCWCSPSGSLAFAEQPEALEPGANSRTGFSCACAISSQTLMCQPGRGAAAAAEPVVAFQPLGSPCYIFGLRRSARQCCRNQQRRIATKRCCRFQNVLKPPSREAERASGRTCDKRKV